MILSFKKFDNLLLYLSLKVGVNFMNSQHLRLKWHFEKLDKYGPRSLPCFVFLFLFFWRKENAVLYYYYYYRQRKSLK